MTGRHREIDLADLAAAELTKGAPGPARSEPRSEVTVYVLELNLSDGSGWTSVHRSYEGARTRLEEKAAAWGVLDELRAAEAGETSDPGCTAAGDAITYGISRLPVED